MGDVLGAFRGVPCVEIRFRQGRVLVNHLHKMTVSRGHMCSGTKYPTGVPSGS